MASVFLALDLALDRKVAIKVMSPAMSASPDNIERFKREAKVSASLNHPHIIGIYAVGDDPDLAYFVMKYIEGRALDSVIRESGAQSVPFVQTIIGAAGKALYYAHSRGVIHRDVKPANFMLDQDGWLIVTDFGIAKLEDTKGLTMTGSVIGTPYYMSPEQFNGKAVSGATDQYALGVVAYELLTGKQPYTGETIVEVMRGHLFDEVPSVRSVRPEIPPALDACIKKMLSKDPAERYSSLEEAVGAFGAVSPTLEAEVRTQIITLAKLGAQAQPRISVPLSPIPVQRPRTPATAVVPPGIGARAAAAKTDPRPARGGTPSRPRPRVDEYEEEPAPKSSVGKILLALVLLLVVAGAGTAVLRPDLLDRFLGASGPSATGDGGVAAAPPIDSTRIRDSIANFQRGLAFADSMARQDSIRRADSLAIVAAALQAESARRAAAAAARRTTPANRPAERAAAPPAEPEPTPQKAAPPAAAAETTRTVATPPPTPAEPPPPTGPGTIRIGSRIAGAVLYLGDEVRPIGQRGVQTLTFPAGPVKISIRAENCASWDTTFTVVSQQTHTIGYRPISC